MYVSNGFSVIVLLNYITKIGPCQSITSILLSGRTARDIQIKSLPYKSYFFAFSSSKISPRRARFYGKSTFLLTYTEKYDKITYLDVLNKKLNVMDSTAISLCMEEEIPIIVFNILKKGNLKKVLQENNIATLIEKAS